MNTRSAKPDMEGRVCLITGGNSGLGREAALALGRMGATIVLAVRNRKRGEATVAEVKDRCGCEDVSLLVADLSRLDDVRRLAKEFKDRHDRLHVLVNNAGVWLSNRQVSADGHEMHLAVDYLAPFLLTDRLLDVLKASKPSRIVNVASMFHRYGKLNLDDIDLEKARFSWGTGYGQAKLAMVLWTYELARRLEGTGVTANAMCPGATATGLWGDNKKGMGRFIDWFANHAFKGPERGAELMVYLASSSDVEGVSGRYFKEPAHLPWSYKFRKGTSRFSEPVRSSKASYDEEVQRRLWKRSEELTVPRPPPPPSSRSSSHS